MQPIDRVESKLDKLAEKLELHSVTLAEIKKDVAKNTDDLEEHIRGVRACEARIAPIEQHVELVGKWMKRGSWLIGLVVAAIVSAAMKYILGQ